MAELTATKIEILQSLLNVSEDDCKVLIEEYGGGGTSEVIQAVYEAMEDSGLESVEDLIWNIRQNPCFRIKRSQSLREKNPGVIDSWSLARSKSSNTINKHTGGVPLGIQQRPASATAQMEGQLPGSTQPMPYSGTKNPIQIVRSQKGVDMSALRQVMSTYLQDTEMRNLLYDVFEQRIPKLLIILRGASGSGKSTLATIIWSISLTGEICSADHYFINRSGQYKFNRASLGEAHETCRIRCHNCLQRGESPVVIDNTNTRVDEMLPYVRLAVEYNYLIKIVEPKTEWRNKANILAKKTVHSVPKRSIQDQLDRFEKVSLSHLVDKVLKQSGKSSYNYQPIQRLEWAAADPPPRSPTITATVQFVPPPPKPTISAPSTIANSTSDKLVVTSTMARQAWIDASVVTPTSKFLLSELVPDLKNGNQKSKRAVKKTGQTSAANTAPASPTVSNTRMVFEDPAHKAFERLLRHFPTVPKAELEKVFNTYEGDLDACASALIEEGAELVTLNNDEWEESCSDALDDKQSPSLDIVSEAAGAWGFDPGTALTTDVVLSELKSQLPMSSIAYNDANLISFADFIEDPDDTTDSSRADEEAADMFEMVLPFNFARSLLGAYGHPDDESRELTQEELTIKVEADTAFELYKALYLNMHEADNDFSRNNYEDSTRSSSPSTDDDEFDAIAISLSQMQLETSSGDPQLNTIINLEEKLNRQTQESLKCFTVPYRTMAQHVSFSMLKQEYPLLDAAVIDEVYCQCHLDVEKTKAALSELYLQTPQTTPSGHTFAQSSNSQSWQVKYNPKDVQMYSPEVLKGVQRNFDDLESKWKAGMQKIRELYSRCSNSDPKIKAYYIKEATDQTAKMKGLEDQMQYYKAITQNAKHRNDQILDLHGLKIAGAMRVLKEFLQFQEEEFVNCGTPKMILLIITGQGKHSKNGCPVLQPAVKNFLSQKNYRFHSAKPGSYTVILTRGSVNAKK